MRSGQRLTRGVTLATFCDYADWKCFITPGATQPKVMRSVQESEGILMKSNRNLALLGSLLAAVGLTPTLLAEEKGALDGCYVQVGGYAESASYSPTEQLGQYRLLLTRKEGCRHRHRALNRVVLKGPFKGAQNDDLTLNHVLGTEDREGLIFTAGDTFFPDAITPCNDVGGVILEGSEIIYPVAGTGIYAGLTEGGSITVRGTINTCTGLNDFEVLSGEGELCFDDVSD
jgi:hypothetical protein